MANYSSKQYPDISTTDKITIEEWIFRKNNIYDYKMVTDEAEKTANILKNGKLTKTQLRKFFNEFKNYERQIDSNESFEKNKAFIYMIKSKAAYSSNKISNEFKNFIYRAIKSINNYENFTDFMIFFESVYGFLKNELKD